MKASAKRHRHVRLGLQILPEHVKADGSPKRRFSTFANANEFGAEHNLDQTPYRCHFCGHWHLRNTD